MALAASGFFEVEGLRQKNLDTIKLFRWYYYYGTAS
jgi:hypothetical protein